MNKIQKQIKQLKFKQYKEFLQLVDDYVLKLWIDDKENDYYKFFSRFSDYIGYLRVLLEDILNEDE